MDGLSDRDQRALQLLSSYIPANRLARIDEVLAGRSRFITTMFENMYHAHNIHAAMRSLECQGIQDLYVVDDEHGSFSRNTSVTKGANYWLDVHVYRAGGGVQSATASCMADLRARGHRIYAADFALDAYTPETLPLDQPVAIVMGTEQAGVSEYVKQHQDGTVMIPMSGFTQSYNVSVALSIIMYTLARRVAQEVPEAGRLTMHERDQLKLRWLRQEIKGARALEQRYIQES